MFEALLFLGSVSAGAIASVAGFGVGSVLTPLFTLAVDTRLAVAAVSIPHLAATSLRLWIMRRQVDWRLLRGSPSACTCSRARADGQPSLAHAQAAQSFHVHRRGRRLRPHLR